MAAPLRPTKGREGIHRNQDIPLGTLRAIVIEQAGLSPEEFNEL
jgi:hypothetical protein